MYTKYEIKNGKVYVYDKLGHSKNMKLASNIKEVLICKNNIEEMKELINAREYDIIEGKKKIRNKSLNYFPLASIWGANSILHIVLNDNWVVGGILSLNFFLNGALGLVHVIGESKYIKINKAKINLIKKYLTEEESKLTKLEQENNESLNYIEPSGNISTSEQIKELEFKLNVLHDYMTNKRHYIKHYKNGSLKNMIKIIGYDSQKQIKFLEELIRQDLGINKYSPVKSIKEVDEDIIHYKM